MQTFLLGIDELWLSQILQRNNNSYECFDVILHVVLLLSTDFIIFVYSRYLIVCVLIMTCDI